MGEKRLTDFVFFGSAVAAAGAVGATSAQAQQDVEGLYMGLSLGVPSGTFIDPGIEYSFDGAGFGNFAGYNAVNGDWVYGAELGFTSEFGADDNGFAGFYSGMGLSDIIDLRGRVGKVFGNTLVYGALGYTMADVDGPGATSTDADGFNIGIGFETPIGERGFIGGEITRRDLDVNGGALYFSSDSIEVNSASVRIGFRF